MPHIARCPKAVEGCGERASGFDASVTHPIGYHDSGTLLRGCRLPWAWARHGGSAPTRLRGLRTADCGFSPTTTTCMTYSRILVYKVHNVLVETDNLETSPNCATAAFRVASLATSRISRARHTLHRDRYPAMCRRTHQRRRLMFIRTDITSAATARDMV
jgi:hypothetical protein